MSSRVVKQAGGVVFRLTSVGPEILLVKAKKKDAWIFPKGHVKKKEKRKHAAVREVKEESGVEARIVRKLDPKLRFESGEETVSVRYFLMECLNESESPEGRPKLWLSPEKALTQLHPDAAELLRDALPDLDEETKLRRARPSSISDPDFKALMLAEYGHTADSLLKNEADGERRAAFFITLTGVTAAALAFVHGRETKLDPNASYPVVAGALAVLLVFGYLTFLRVIRRNLASDRYKHALNRIRRSFVNDPNDPRCVFLAFDPFSRDRRSLPSWKSLGRGGWLETVAVIEAMITGALVAALVPKWPLRGILFAAAAFAGWILLLQDAIRRYRHA